MDPLLGLIPGAGDWLGAVLSLYVFYEGARLGMPRHVLTRMAGNILVETILGSVPVLGDLFDFAWQANTRNLALIERHYEPRLVGRSMGRLWFVAGLVALLVLVVLAGLLFLIMKGIEAVFR